MVLNSSGKIKFSDINLELGFPFNSRINLNNSNIKTLINYTSGKINLRNFYSKGVIFTPSNGLLFNGINNYLSINGNNDFAVGTDDFTVEWWQYQTDNNSYPRIFTISTFGNAPFGVSIEGGSFYAWLGGSGILIGNVSIKNQWTHIAITRQSSNFRVFINGIQLGNTINNTSNLSNNTSPLLIGSEATLSGSYYSGKLIGFHFVKGTALYTSNFTRPKALPVSTSNTKLLLLATNEANKLIDSSGTNKIVNNINNVGYI